MRFAVVPESKNPYLITHYNGRHDLLAVPETYSVSGQGLKHVVIDRQEQELEIQVKRLYDVEKGTFYVETSEFNANHGTRVRIPEEAWADFVPLLENDLSQLMTDGSAQLRGHIHIVPLLETCTEGKSAILKQETKIGDIVLNEPFANGKVLMICLDVATEHHWHVMHSAASRSDFQILDQTKNVVFTISVLPASGWIFLTTLREGASFPDSTFSFDTNSEHVITIQREGGHFHVFCDFNRLGSVHGPSDIPLTTLRYHLGPQSPFAPPVSAVIYSSLLFSFEESALHHSLFPVVDNETFFQQIISGEGINPVYVSEVLSTVRDGNKSVYIGRRLTSSIKWKRHSSRSHNHKWTDLKWKMHHRTIFFTRFAREPRTNLGGALAPSSMRVSFSTAETKGLSGSFLQITVDSDGVSVYEDHNGEGNYHGSVWLPPSSHHPMEHTIAFIFQQNHIHFIYDYCYSDIISRTWTPAKIKFDVLPGYDDIEAGVFDFN